MEPRATPAATRGQNPCPHPGNTTTKTDSETETEHEHCYTPESPKHLKYVVLTYTHQKTITVDNKESYISTGNFDTTYYATSRDYGVFDTDAADVAAIVAVFNADYAKTSITPSDGDDLVWSPTDSQTHLLALINGAQHSLDVQQEEFSDTALVNALVSAENRGVTVRVVVENPSSYTSELNQITAAGGKWTGYSSSTGFYIHAKTIIADYGTSAAKAFAGGGRFLSRTQRGQPH